MKKEMYILTLFKDGDYQGMVAFDNEDEIKSDAEEFSNDFECYLSKVNKKPYSKKNKYIFGDIEFIITDVKDVDNRYKVIFDNDEDLNSFTFKQQQR